MTFQLSPGVTLREFDRTLSIQAGNTGVAGFAGGFNWGPAEQILRIESIKKLEDTFGHQGTDNIDFLLATQFLAYSNNLRLVRAVHEDSKNATSDANGILIRNDKEYYESFEQGQASAGEFCAKYPGTKGNGLAVSYADAGSWTVTKSGSTAGNALTSAGLENHSPGDKIYVGDVQVATIVSITNDTTATLNATLSPALDDDSFTIKWQYADQFQILPSTSEYAAENGSSNDEIHLLIVDRVGNFGPAGAILEKYEFLSKASDAKLDNGESNFYKNVLNTSKYVRWLDFPEDLNWGTSTTETASYNNAPGAKTHVLAGGVLEDITAADKIRAFQKFISSDEDEPGVLFAGVADVALANGVIAVAESLKYAMAVVSPESADVINNAGNEVDDIIDFKSNLTASGQLFVDTGWKIAYDNYNARFVSLPLNADIAGLLVRVETEDGISASPASPANSFIRNCIRLTFNPTELERDVLYANSVNPVVTFPGTGTILFGDRTAITRKSAFRYVGARRMFNLVKKSLARSSRGFLFVRNTQAERSRFANQIRGYLNTLRDNNDIIDFRVVVDSSNNTQEMIQSQTLVADVYIQPVYSINWVLINMHATQQSANFNETVTSL